MADRNKYVGCLPLIYHRPEYVFEPINVYDNWPLPLWASRYPFVHEGSVAPSMDFETARQTRQNLRRDIDLMPSDPRYERACGYPPAYFRIFFYSTKLAVEVPWLFGDFNEAAGEVPLSFIRSKEAWNECIEFLSSA